MRRLVPFFLVPLLLTGCNHSWFSEQTPYLETDEVSRVVITYSEKMRFERNLELEDSVIVCGSRINGVRLDYSCMDTLHIWDARTLLVDTVEGFLGKINSNQKIADSLYRPQMQPEDLEVYIRFTSFYTQFVDTVSVGMVCMRNGMVTYYAADAEDCDVDCWHRRTESYAQSKNFVEYKRQGDALYRPKEGEDPLSATFGKERFIPIEAAPRR